MPVIFEEDPSLNVKWPLCKLISRVITGFCSGPGRSEEKHRVSFATEMVCQQMSACVLSHTIPCVCQNRSRPRLSLLDYFARDDVISVSVRWCQHWAEQDVSVTLNVIILEDQLSLHCNLDLGKQDTWLFPCEKIAVDIFM